MVTRRVFFPGDHAHVAASLYLTAAGIAATIAVIAALCGARSHSSRRKSAAPDDVAEGGGGEVKKAVWMKTIILGEKCRVSCDGGDEDNGVIFEAKDGKKITAYHPRTLSSLPLSRQCSLIDHDAVSRLELGLLYYHESDH